MKRSDIGHLHRLLRQRAGLTQADLAHRAGVGRWKVIALEANRLGKLTIDEIDQCFGTLDARLSLTVFHHGAEVERVRDERHAALVAAIVAILRQAGWEVRVEVTFNDYGDRGAIDVLAWHAAQRSLLVIEVKSELGSVEGTLRPFAVKCRLAAKIARDQFGWRSESVSRALILPEERTARRAVERHRSVFDSVLPSRSRELRTWLRDPARPMAGIWFLSDVGRGDVTRNPSAIRRVRGGHPRSRVPANVVSRDI